MEKQEAYNLGRREDKFFGILKENGFFHYISIGSTIFIGDKSCRNVGHIHPDPDASYLIISSDVERIITDPKLRESFSKLRKLAEEF